MNADIRHHDTSSASRSEHGHGRAARGKYSAQDTTQRIERSGHHPAIASRAAKNPPNCCTQKRRLLIPMQLEMWDVVSVTQVIMYGGISTFFRASEKLVCYGLH